MSDMINSDLFLTCGCLSLFACRRHVIIFHDRLIRCDLIYRLLTSNIDLCEFLWDYLLIIFIMETYLTVSEF